MLMQRSRERIDYRFMFKEVKAPQWFVTLHCGRQTEISRLRPDYRPGGAADLLHGQDAVDLFFNAVLTSVFGRKWARRENLRYAFLAYPETREREVGDTTPLHFHCIIAFADPRDKDEAALRTLLLPIWNEVSRRKFGHVQDIDIRKVENLGHACQYIQKFSDTSTRESNCAVHKMHGYKRNG